jgi:peptidoglycan/xylan/chitin deacetylase (PgdA/CDA1 family)
MRTSSTPNSNNGFSTFWKLPDDAAQRCVVANGWTAIGCSVPAVRMPSEPERKRFHSIGARRIYARVARYEPCGRWWPMLSMDSGCVLLWADETSTRFLFPFDVDEVIADTLAERYRTEDRSGALLQAFHRVYYRVRPAIPRSVQMMMKRSYASVQSGQEFPAWPVEDSLTWLLNLLAWCIARTYGDAVPAISFWPEGRRFCAAVTHDVETAHGVSNIPRLVEIEKRIGIRSSWNFVPERYSFDLSVVRHLQQEGFEVGVHGLTHDGRLFESETTFRARAERINGYAHLWGSVGFRSPACHRNYDWMKTGALNFAYDSSYPDTDFYQPMPGGCCTVFPWFLGDMVELPITLPQDHVVFDIRGDSARLWHDKLKYIESVGGLALLIVHPDYMTDNDRLRQYELFLRHLKDQSDAWLALPHQVASWWRFRASAGIRVVDGVASAIPALGDTQFPADTLDVSWLAPGSIPGQLVDAHPSCSAFQIDSSPNGSNSWIPCSN